MKEQSEKMNAYRKLTRCFFDSPKMTAQELIEEAQRLNLYGAKYLKGALIKYKREEKVNHER